MATALVPALAAAVVGACGTGNTSSPRTEPRRLLDADGIASVTFGQAPALVATTLGRLFGPPVGVREIGFTPAARTAIRT